MKGPGSARSGTTGGLWSFNHVFEFEYVSSRPDFNADSPYLVPGSVPVATETGGLTCSLFTTMNFSLNLIRARQWYGHSHIPGAVDHTFKVTPISHTFARCILCRVNTCGPIDRAKVLHACAVTLVIWGTL